MAKSPPPPFCILRGHEGSITTLYFTNENSNCLISSPTLISGSDKGEIFFWNLKTLRTYHRLKGHNGKMILFISFCNSTLLSQGREGPINLWMFKDDQWIISRTIQGANYGFCPAQLLINSSFTFLIVPDGESTSLTMYDYESCNIVHKFNYKTSDVKNSLGLCMCMKTVAQMDNFYILMGFDGGCVVLWEFNAKTFISELKCHPEVVFCLDYDIKHKNKGISGSSDDVLQTWIIRDNKLIKDNSVKITNPGVCAIKIRDDGKIVISAGQDGAIRVFSWKNLKFLAVLKFHVAQINTLSFYMDEFCDYKSIFASGSKDKVICLWSIY